MERDDYLKIDLMGTSDIMDPMKPKIPVTLSGRIGTLATYMLRLLKKHPNGITLDKTFVLDFLGRRKITSYARRIFKRYDIKLKVYTKKPYIDVMKIVNNDNS